MKIFTLWNQSLIPAHYQACIDSWAETGLDLEVIRFDDNGKPPMIVSDNQRIEMLATQWLDEDALYVDADCIPGVDFGRISILPRDKPAFLLLRGWQVDISVCYRPAGQHPLFEALAARKNPDSGIGYYKTILDREYLPHRLINVVHGYPDNVTIEHCNYSICPPQQPNPQEFKYEA